MASDLQSVELPPERSLTLFIDSDQLLRKPNSTAQRRRFAGELDRFQAAAREQAGALGFVALTGPVSVSLDVHAPERGQVPLLPPVIKAHLDALNGIAYVDDRQVEHLVVRQDAHAHPLMDGAAPLDGAPRGAAVFIEVEPVEDYTARFDRAFKRTWARRGHTPWRRGWTVGRDAELQRLRSELQNAHDGDRESSRRLLRRLEEDRFRDGTLVDIDRPGPLPPVVRALHRVVPGHRLHGHLRRRAGATFLVPLRGQEDGSSARWASELDAALSRVRATQPAVPLDGFVALDIAVRGASLQGKDLDNLAHSILGPLETALCVRRGTVLSYRVYTAVGEPEGVQVRVLDHARMLELEALLREMQTREPTEERLRRWSERMNERLDARRRQIESRRDRSGGD